ncbi:(2E,6E)-farnesyl diphosphate synthase [Pasteurellaceae bacterium HPA106]|uniref:(2E,6E)-farnesyl diphosphate synthase n=1 Tax=Spirabiliibacterium pneumoniae TaxID=221400 RepID=UPI001AADE574|nr:(2E,6E)-farnesyl diphosphate synthase [Spirabiliibacterium pneumoniae]MBE2896525.1 (2E,6E)-farnesyl diphosphate synthase [Spirabiliibacterium pneumoniae]
MNYNFQTDLQHFRARINTFLTQKLDLDSQPAPLADAMRYGVLLGGKRLRPFLTYCTGRMLNAPLASLDFAAAAVEAVHCYSLIHDDLPAMDDDTLRRGQNTCHIEFDQATAILAGDALQSWAFTLLCDTPTISAEQKVRLVQLLSHSAGAQGMCLGQALDLFAEQQAVDLTFLERIHHNKTGAMIICAVEMGLVCSPHFADPTLAQHLRRFASLIGLAFQVQDDILDITADSATLGKDAGSDLAHDKSTYPKLLGLDGAKAKAQALIEQAQQVLGVLANMGLDVSAHQALAAFIITRGS